MRKMAALAVLATSMCIVVETTGVAQDATGSPPSVASATPDTSSSTSPAAQPWGKPVQTDINPGQMVTYPSINRDIQAYFVTPKIPQGTPLADATASADDAAKAKPKMPSILYIHDIFGMTDFAKSQADSLARQGYAVLMPNLYTRVDNSEKGFDAQSAWVAYERTTDPQMRQDLLAAIEYLQAEGKPTADQPLAVVGHDLGGIFAMLIASSDLRVKAAVNYYGRVVYPNITPARPNSPVEELFNLRAPLLSFYGTEDPQIPREQVRALESRLSHNPNRTYYEIVQFPNVGHGFLVPGRQGYNPQAAAASEEKVRNFLAKYLRPEPKKDDE
jgi:carboxymethylenebutenolidase